MSRIAALLDEAALCLLGVDSGAHGEFSQLESQFAELAKLLDDERQSRAAHALRQAATMIAGCGVTSGGHAVAQLEIAAQLIAGIQAVLDAECSWEDARFPEALLGGTPELVSEFQCSTRTDPTSECRPEPADGLADSAEQQASAIAAELASEFTLSRAAEDHAASGLLDPELLEGFVLEAQEHLETVDVQLLSLDSDPQNQEGLSAVFRAFHTIKGVAGFMELHTIGGVAHEAENILDLAREGKLLLVGPAIDAVFSAADMLKKLITGLSTGEDPLAEVTTRESVEMLLKTLQRVAAQLPLPAEIEATAPAEPKDLPAASFAVPASTQAETLRVDRERLDSLVDMIGELVIAEAMVQQDIQASGEEEAHGARNLAQLNKITRNLQELSLSLRMVPIRATFQKMARMVRDLSKKLLKPIEFHVVGEETELDKTVVDQIGDPLMHMVRNAVDHGIEANPQERLAAGKTAHGNVTLRAFHQGGNIYVEIHDDGRGLDPAKIMKKARERGLLAPDATLSDSEALQLIFQPGFSTAEKVTDVSGRGVGMDVVRRNIETLRGSIELRSEPGQGTCISMRLPLTLAIIDGMVVSVGQSRYIIPTLSIVELLRPQPQEVATVSGRGEYFTIRDSQLPLIRVGRLFRESTWITEPAEAIVVVVEDGRKKAGLLVDAVHGQQQAVIKSLGHRLEGQRGLAGGAVMPDGKVGLILDVHGLLDSADESPVPTLH